MPSTSPPPSRRPILKAGVLLALTWCIATLILPSPSDDDVPLSLSLSGLRPMITKEEDPSASSSSWRMNYDYDPRQLSAAFDPKTVESRVVGEPSIIEQGVATINSAIVVSTSDSYSNMANANTNHFDFEQQQPPLTVCGRPTKTPLLENPTLQSKYSSCPANSNKDTTSSTDKILLISGAWAMGQTGNRLVEFLHAIQQMRDMNNNNNDNTQYQLGIIFDSWAMQTITSMWLSIGIDGLSLSTNTNNNSEENGHHPPQQLELDKGNIPQEWVQAFEEAFCIKIYSSYEQVLEEYGNGDDGDGEENVIHLNSRQLFNQISTASSMEEYIQSQMYTIRTLFRHVNTPPAAAGNKEGAVGVTSSGKPVKDMCSGIAALFGNDNDNNETPIKYSVIHSRSYAKEHYAGNKILRRISRTTGIDPKAALLMEPSYVKSILRPLGMLRHPIVFMSDGQNPSVLEKLMADAELGPLIRVLSSSGEGKGEDAPWVGGDITLGVMADVFIGNPASTFTTFIAKARLALGMRGAYLFRARRESSIGGEQQVDENDNQDDGEEWVNVCEEDCVFRIGVVIGSNSRRCI